MPIEQQLDFEVLVSETSPFFTGHETAKLLQEAGLRVYIIPDSNVYAVMSRIDKVIISCQAILANGGLLAPAGAYMLCLAAKVSQLHLSLTLNSGILNPSYSGISDVQVNSHVSLRSNQA